MTAERTLIDTDIAILMANGDESVIQRISALPHPPLMSIVSHVELLGALSDAAAEEAHRDRVEAILALAEILSFTTKEVQAYERIVPHLGFSRRKVVDRMIAAQALVARAKLATRDVRDFRGIPDLTVEDWSG